MLHLAYHSILARYPVEQIIMYDSPGQDFYRPHMVVDVYNIVENCMQFPRLGATFKQQQLVVFPFAGFFEIFAIKIQGQFRKARQETISLF